MRSKQHGACLFARRQNALELLQTAFVHCYHTHIHHKMGILKINAPGSGFFITGACIKREFSHELSEAIRVTGLLYINNVYRMDCQAGIGADGK